MRTLSYPRRLPLSVACAVLLVALGTGCSDSTREDEQRIRAVITEAYTGKDPAMCTALMTQAFVEQSELRRGRVAVERCEADARDDQGTTTVDIRRVTVDGDRANARFESAGPEVPFSPVELQLRRSGEDWKLDRVAALTVDREKFIGAGKRDFPPSIADCVLREYRLLSDDEIEQAFVASKATRLFAPAVVCSVEPELRRTDLPARVVDCAIRGLRGRSRDGRLDQLLGEDAKTVEDFDQVAFEDELRLITGRCAKRASRPA